jgi:SpoVK/Ycf46/Vps4 family AAA+-type ATPase
VSVEPSVTAFKHGNIQTFKINFTEKNGKKGSVTIAGQFKADLPGFRVMVQKEWSTNDPFIQLVTKLLDESYKPSEAREARKVFLEFLTVGTSYQTTPTTKAPESAEVAMKELQELGVEVILPNHKERFTGKSWDELGGYERQKRDIEDTILLGLTHGDIYDQIGRGTRVKFEKNRPKTVLFEGPPGTGKTSSAKIIASQVNIPLIYVPAEAILSKWFGESEKSMATLFEKCAQLGKAIIFIDEIDALGSSRETDQLHEASRRIVSTLLRKLDSFESENDLLLICATNQKERLDPALLSRVDLSIKFDLPDAFARQAIFKRYAKQLSETELRTLAQASEGLSGRGILETCRDVERRWASKFIRKEVEEELPGLDTYIHSLEERLRNRLL